MELSRLKPLVEKSRRAPDSVEGIWRDYPKDQQVSVKIRPLLPSAIRVLENESLRARLEGGMLRDAVDDEVFEAKIRNYLIEDWRGITLEGEAAEPDEGNIQLLFDGCAPFGVWVLGESKALAEAALDAEEDSLKNSGPSFCSGSITRTSHAKTA